MLKLYGFHIGGQNLELGGEFKDGPMLSALFLALSLASFFLVPPQKSMRVAET